MLPAAGQGALGIEICTGRADLIDALKPLAHSTSWLAVAAERAVSRAMGGSCSMPLAAHATLSGATLSLRAAWGDPEGSSTLVTAQTVADVGSLEHAESLGTQVAAELRRGGAH
jgi:hydroxymethylbilane synthase